MKPFFKYFICAFCVLVSFGEAYAQRPVSSMLTSTDVEASLETALNVAVYEGDGMMVPIDGWKPWIVPDTTPLPPEVIPDYCVPGTVPYEYNIGSNGKVNISIPIEDFSGENEFPPGLSLFYNGNSKFDILGTGWKINGLSVISRAPKDWFTDGYVDGVKRDSSDAVYLDGVRLLFLYESDGKRWYKSQSGETRAYYDTGSNYFMVLYPDGSCAKYGITNNVDYHRSWIKRLDESVISYSYYNSVGGDNIRIKEINYGDNRRMDFNYGRVDDENIKKCITRVNIYHISIRSMK